MSHSQGTSGSRGFEIRFFGILALFVATLVLMYGATFRGDETVRGTLLTATMFLGTGLSFAFMMSGLRFKFWDMRIYETILWTSMSFGVIYLVNRYVPISFEVTSAISVKWLGVLVGIAEECFFRVWLCGTASQFSKWGAIIGSSIIWSAYHVARYGGAWNTHIIIIVAGLVLGWIYLETKVADGVIFAHALVNYLAL